MKIASVFLILLTVACASSRAVQQRRANRDLCRAQARPVRITANPNAVNGCAYVGNMGGALKPTAEWAIKEEAAAMCGDTVFIGNRDFFEVYRCE